MRPSQALPAVLAAAVIVAVELVRAAAFGLTELVGAGAWPMMGFALCGLLGVPLALAGWGLGAGAWLARRGAPLGDRAGLEAWLALALLALSGSAAVLLAVQRAVIVVGPLVKRPVYHGLAAGLVAVGVGLACLAVGLLLWRPLTRVLFGVLARLPARVDPQTTFGAVLWLVVVATLALVLPPLILPELRTVDLRPAQMGFAWLIVLVVAVRALAPLAHRIPSRTAWAVLAATGLLGVSSLAWSAGALGATQSRRLVLDRDTVLAGRIVRVLASLSDRDGDGIPGAFGGADCDDADPSVRPGVYDPPGDGIDQNCTGADLDPKADPMAAPKRRLPPEGGQKHNVVLVTLDAVRKDLADVHMPNLKALAAEGIDYANAYAAGASTYWSMPALLGGKMPSRFEMARDQTPVRTETLLTEVLWANGWHTALYANVTIFFVRGLRQGARAANYETSDFTTHGATPGSEHLTDGMMKYVRSWKAGRQQPNRPRFFLWGHYYDPHDPYFEVPGYPAEEKTDKSRYEAILRYTDHHLGRLFEGLKAEGLWDSTVIIVTSDHGDEFLDHGHRFHGKTLYDEMVKVPLVVRVPGVAPRVVETPIGAYEVAPTLLELLSVKIPDAFEGRTRFEEVLEGATVPVEPVFFEVLPDSNYGTHQVGMRLGDLKLIHRIREGYYELYDLAADPLERRNVFDSHPDAEALETRLGVYLDHHLFHMAKGKTGAEVPPGSPAPEKKKKRRRR